MVNQCCELGRAWAIQSLDLCGPYPAESSYIGELQLYAGPAETLACTALVDACCVLLRRDKQCTAGKETAVLLNRCDGLHLYQANEDAKVSYRRQNCSINRKKTISICCSALLIASAGAINYSATHTPSAHTQEHTHLHTNIHTCIHTQTHAHLHTTTPTNPITHTHAHTTATCVINFFVVAVYNVKCHPN